MKNSTLYIKGYSTTIVLLSDWHIGNVACDLDLIKRTVRFIRNTKNCYAIVLGDLLDLCTPHSKGLVGEQTLTGTAQFETVENLLKPIKNKILFSVIGNHERRMLKDANTDAMAILSKLVGMDYCGSEKHFIIKFNDRVVKCYAHHGAGGGSSSTSKLNALFKLHYRSPFCDIIFMGHTHDNIDPQKILPYIDRNGVVRKKLQQYVTAGSALNSDIGYAADNAYPPTPTCAKVVHIQYSKKYGLQFNIQKIQ